MVEFLFKNRLCFHIHSNSLAICMQNGDEALPKILTASPTIASATINSGLALTNTDYSSIIITKPLFMWLNNESTTASLSLK